MSMPVLDKRLQLLIDGDRLSRIEQEAKRGSRSVASVVRDAIDEHLVAAAGVRSAAGRRLLALPMDASPEPDWRDTKAALEAEMSTRLAP
jgi:hypothetical protein